MKRLLFSLALLLIVGTAQAGDASQLDEDIEINKACMGLALTTKQLAEYRDQGLSEKKAVKKMVSTLTKSGGNKEVATKIANTSKEIAYRNADMKPWTVYFLSNYVCASSINGIPAEFSSKFLSKTARICQSEYQKPEMLNGCIQMGYHMMLEKKDDL